MITLHKWVAPIIMGDFDGLTLLSRHYRYFINLTLEILDMLYCRTIYWIWSNHHMIYYGVPLGQNLRFLCPRIESPGTYCFKFIVIQLVSRSVWLSVRFSVKFAYNFLSLKCALFIFNMHILCVKNFGRTLLDTDIDPMISDDTVEDMVSQTLFVQFRYFEINISYNTFSNLNFRQGTSYKKNLSVIPLVSRDLRLPVVLLWWRGTRTTGATPAVRPGDHISPHVKDAGLRIRAAVVRVSQPDFNFRR